MLRSAHLSPLQPVHVQFWRVMLTFAHFAVQVAEGCMNSKNPFHDDVVDCPQLETIKSELAAAGSTAQSALMVGYVTDAPFDSRGTPEVPTTDNDFYAESMPRVDQMLYRLLALAVTAQYDHEENSGGCFYRRDSRHGAREICQDVYGAATTQGVSGMTTFHTEADGLPTLAYTDYTKSENGALGMKVEFQTYQHRVATMVSRERRIALADVLSETEVKFAPSEDLNVYGADAFPQAKTCHMQDGDYDRWHPPPPTPPYARGAAEYAPSAPPLAPGGDGAAGGPVHAAVLDACTHNLEWGLWDQARLFGLSDVVMPFEIGPREVVGFNTRSIGPLVIDALFTDPVKAATTQNKNPRFLMRMWTACRLTVATISMTMAGAALGFFLMFGALPLIGTILIQTLGFKDEATDAEFMMMPPELKNQVMYAISTGVSIPVVFWLLLVDPSHQTPYMVVDDCSVYAEKKSGGAYLTTDFRNNYGIQADWIFGWVLIIVFVLPLTYSLLRCILLNRVLKKVDENKDKSRVNSPGNGNATMAMFVFAIANITIASILTTIRGLEWADLSDDAEYVGESFQAEWFADECQMVVLTGVFFGLSIGNITQRWAVERFDDLVIYAWGFLSVGFFAGPVAIRISLMRDTYAAEKGPWRNEDEATTSILIVIFNVVALASVVPIFQNAITTADAKNSSTPLSATGKQTVRANSADAKLADSEAADDTDWAQDEDEAPSGGFVDPSYMGSKNPFSSPSSSQASYGLSFQKVGWRRHQKAGTISDRKVYLPMLRLPAQP